MLGTLVFCFSLSEQALDGILIITYNFHVMCSIRCVDIQSTFDLVPLPLQCTHVVEYARDTYSHTGSSLLDSIAIVHPFVVSTLLNRVTTPTETVREVRIYTYMYV